MSTRPEKPEIVKTVAVRKAFVCRLTSSEYDERSGALARQVQHHSEVETEKKRVMADYKERLDGIGLEVQRLSRVVSTREETREIDCDEIWDYENRILTTIRRDTGEETSRRRITDAEQDSYFARLRAWKEWNPPLVTTDGQPLISEGTGE
jgi:hypothetical protein